MNALLIWAQAAADPISGGAGWVGAGLLGLVLGWLLLVHLPGKDKLLRDLVDGFESRHREARAEYRETLTQILGFGERQISSVASRLAAELEQLRKAIQAISREGDE